MIKLCVKFSYLHIRQLILRNSGIKFSGNFLQFSVPIISMQSFTHELAIVEPIEP